MFANYPDRVKPEPTPERMMALLQMLSRGSISKEALKQAISLSNVFQVEVGGAYGILYNAVKELGLLQEIEGNVQLTLSKEKLESYKLFRKTIANIVLQRKKSTFFLISQRFLALNEEVFSIQNWEQMSHHMSDEQYIFQEEDLLGWRWWAGFLGLGYLHGKTMIPNMGVRLADALEENNILPPGEYLPIEDFVRWMETFCPETSASRKERILGLGASNGLRLLSGQGILEFREQMDAERWSLYPIEVHAINQITHVKVRG